MTHAPTAAGSYRWTSRTTSRQPSYLVVPTSAHWSPPLLSCFPCSRSPKSCRVLYGVFVQYALHVSYCTYSRQPSSVLVWCGFAGSRVHTPEVLELEFPHLVHHLCSTCEVPIPFRTPHPCLESREEAFCDRWFAAAIIQSKLLQRQCLCVYSDFFSLILMSQPGLHADTPA